MLYINNDWGDCLALAVYKYFLYIIIPTCSCKIKLSIKSD